MIKVGSTGDFRKTEARLKKLARGDYMKNLESYAKEGVTALASATPVDSAKVLALSNA